MPNAAFYNLADDKRSLIIAVAMAEFSSASYDKASINQICKRAGIAKGSFYQYFTDKLDLYVHIMTLAVEKKVGFFTAALEDFKTLTLQAQIRLLFLKGIEFAKAHPSYAALGEQFAKETNETAKSAVIKEGEKRSESLFVQMIEAAKTKGEVGRGVDTLALSLQLQTLNKTVTEYLQDKSGADQRSFTEGAEQLVDSLLYIIFHGIRPQ